MSESERNRQDTAVYGDVVGGDKITVGDIDGVKGVAIGEGASVTINEMARKYWYFLVMVLILLIIVILILPAINKMLPERRPQLQIEQEIKEMPIGSELQGIDAQGNITLLATRQGIVWFDNETGGSARILNDYWVTSVAIDSQNNDQIWFGTNEGLVGQYNLENKNTRIIEHPLLKNWITAINVDQYGTVWIADSENGILKLTEDADPKEFPLPGNQSSVKELIAFSSELGDAIVALTRREIFIWYDGVWQVPLNVSREGIVTSMTSDGEDTLWFTQNDKVVQLHIPMDFNRAEIESSMIACAPIENNISTGVAIDVKYESGSIWLISQGGVARKQINDRDPDECGIWVSSSSEGLHDWDRLPASQIDVSFYSDCISTLWVIEQSTRSYRTLRLSEC